MGVSYPSACSLPVAELNWKAVCVERRTYRLEGGKGREALPILTPITTCERTQMNKRCVRPLQPLQPSIPGMAIDASHTNCVDRDRSSTTNGWNASCANVGFRLGVDPNGRERPTALMPFLAIRIGSRIWRLCVQIRCGCVISPIFDSWRSLCTWPCSWMSLHVACVAGIWDAVWIRV
jgi:hypothetical protein